MYAKFADVHVKELDMLFMEKLIQRLHLGLKHIVQMVIYYQGRIYEYEYVK